MQDSTKRLECLKAAFDVSPKKQLGHEAAADSLKRAFAGMQASINVGISYNNYQTTLLDLAKAVATYKQDAGQEGIERSRLFDAALEAYGDAGTFWERSISFYARRGNDIAYSGGMPVSLNGLDWLVNKYNLPTTKSDFWGLERGLPVQTTRAAIWRIASKKAEDGFSTGTGKMTEEYAALLWLPYELGNNESEKTAVDKIGIGSDCTKTPFLARTEQRTAIGREYVMRCTDGTTMKVVCESAVCRVLLDSAQSKDR